MKKILQILDVEERKSKAGNMFRVAQCVVKGDKVRVGELMIFNKEIQVAPGEFEAEFDVTVNFERQVGAELVALRPTGKPLAASRSPATV